MTLFKAELAKAIADGIKTQTRRPVKTGEYLEVADDGTKTVFTADGKIKMQTGRNYSIQWGRGKPCRWWHPQKKVLVEYEVYCDVVEKFGKPAGEKVLADKGCIPFRYEITDIRCEDVRNISHADALAEGFEYAPKFSFLHTWMMFYDDTFAYRMLTTKYALASADWCPIWLWERPDDKYQAFAYTFKIYISGELTKQIARQTIKEAYLKGRNSAQSHNPY